MMGRFLCDDGRIGKDELLLLLLLLVRNVERSKIFTCERTVD